MRHPAVKGEVLWLSSLPHRPTGKYIRKAESDVPVDVEVGQVCAGRSRKKQRFKDGGKYSRLPNEVLGIIFGHLTWEERIQCRLTCQHWNAVVLATPTLWMNPPRMRGSLAKITEVMTGPLAQRSAKGRYRALTLHLLAEATPMEDEKYKVLVHHFPSATLRELRCTRRNDHAIDDGTESSPDNAKLWQCITSCSLLKVLHWKSVGNAKGSFRSAYGVGTYIEYSLQNSALAACRLDEFIFDAPYEVILDDAFLCLISNVKRLDISARWTASQLEAIFDTVKDSIEELTFTNYTDQLDSLDYYDELEVKMCARRQTMPRLKYYHAAFSLIGTQHTRQQLPTPYQIVAPRVTSLTFMRLASIDWVLVDSCRDTLESFCVGTGGEELPLRLQQELFNMPVLRAMALDLTNDEDCDYKCGDQYFFDTFWTAVDRADTGRPDICIREVLPRLESLTIVADKTFTFARITGFLDLRQQLGHTSIVSLTLWYDGNGVGSELSMEEYGILKRRVPRLEIRYCGRASKTESFCDAQRHRNFVEL